MIQALLECITWLVEIISRSLWFCQIRNAKQFAIGCPSTMIHQKIIQVESSQSISFTFTAITIHPTGILVLCPVYLIYLLKEDIEILDTSTTICPFRHRIAISSPRTCSHLEKAICQVIAYSVICSNISNTLGIVRKHRITISQ
ncbi:Uncharacterised protein [Segatella copri]|nr:Uncharacterised protein [Segatella copri]